MLDLAIFILYSLCSMHSLPIHEKHKFLNVLVVVSLYWLTQQMANVNTALIRFTESL